MKSFSLLVVLAAACGPSNRDRTDAGFARDAVVDAPCPTAIVGKVFAPNGTLPLYNVQVYIPQTNPPPFPAGVQCGNCNGGMPGGAVAKTTSGPDGSFRLDNVPPGNDVPIIITTGKWRRKLTVPYVGQCQDTVIPDGTFRLPRNKSEGELPHIAVVTGGCDPLACILSKLGIDSVEFGASSAGTTSVVFYNGVGGTAPGTPQPATALWGSLDEMKKFDIIINSCECAEENTEKTTPDLLRQYADLGGRVFGSHFHYTWTKNLIPQWQGTAVWTAGSYTEPDMVDQSFNDGQAFAKWLLATGASTTLGIVDLGTKTPNVSTVNPPTTRWLYSSGTPATTHYLSFLTPVGMPPAQQCGKVVYAGLHVASGSTNLSTFPSTCTTGLTPDEKALVFLLFDLGSCVDIIL